MVKEERSRERQSLDQAVLDSNYPLDHFRGAYKKQYFLDISNSVDKQGAKQCASLDKAHIRQR